MKNTQFSEIKKMSSQEIKERIIQKRKMLFHLRFQMRTQESKHFKSSAVGLAKKDIARCKTALTQKSIDGSEIK